MQKTTNFRETITDIDSTLLWLDELKTLQVNLGNRCNQQCVHCHIQASPQGKKIMPQHVMQSVILFLTKHPGLCLDITGGCPELNPNFKFFISSAHKFARPIIVRTNLTIFFEPGMNWIPKWYANHNIVIMASLPCYTRENVDAQRGAGVFNKSIAALRMLNELGYGQDPQLELNLVYNPQNDSLGPSQEQLEADYKEELLKNYGIKFNKLFKITNAPIGRFKQFLQKKGLLEKYQQILTENFNQDTVEHIMCRNLISVDYRGQLYNCDFNLALNLPLTNSMGKPATIAELNDILNCGIEIITADHCFCCTAGAGTSCTGSLVKQPYE